MQLEVSRFKVPLEIGETVVLDMEELFAIDERIVDIAMSTLPWDSEHIQLVVVVTKRSVAEQDSHEARGLRSFLSGLPELDE